MLKRVMVLAVLMQSLVAKMPGFDKVGGRFVPWSAREKLVVVYFVVIYVCSDY